MSSIRCSLSLQYPRGAFKSISNNSRPVIRKNRLSATYLAKRKRPLAVYAGRKDSTDDDEIYMLTDAERKLLEADPIEDSAALPSPDSLKLDQQKIDKSDEQNNFYADRKKFIDFEDLKQTHKFGIAMAHVAAETKCQSIRLLAVHTHITWTDVFLLVTAMSRTQLRAVLGKMEKVALEQWQMPVLEAVTRRSEWECIDFGDLVVHAFSPRTRSYFNLDKIYSECEEIIVPDVGVGATEQWTKKYGR